MPEVEFEVETKKSELFSQYHKEYKEHLQELGWYQEEIRRQQQSYSENEEKYDYGGPEEQANIKNAMEG